MPSDANFVLFGGLADAPATWQALLDAGVPMDYSCEGGVCGTCVVPLVSGQVEHMDEFLMDDEQDSQMITCVSRGEGEIEIDV